MVNDFQFYLYSILAVIILSLAVAFFLKKYMIMPILTLIVMGIAAFVLPNFYDNLEWQPLLGYAAFLAVLSFVITMSIWVVNRNRKHSKELRQAEETIEEAERKKEI
ncbi:hypothetical protein JEOAER750_01086 [Jeotgalicoccus aerolatus]|mgnify:FL=1|jgi:membrane protein implicated in regulation of membrane protease activity|uniref:Membrane protein implicated in regulation of membrane protease activity n=1 Tax=Jeotgalicoccus aerolatus TaxID=709510 RepID=A0A1G8V6M6_9STAP|nr:hypothetical protein [Jeotgalicoccus aerolatus]MBP1951854.1 membrane protein implicated in regulation of membrane protease activity [Jeotgalicoccus aerolatus]NMA80787.1 hypothetical protein [Jeotgalicoccus aerolatus]CAD2074972.1 hypothetical protein JEOAER750_01086 [Jeotgalicoccus aerolatus]SDJ60975.1 hypothetical protein SAMN05216187_101213 [Jeotgalicoccus aerolatus]GGD94253.1 hypothetical protein GCM10007273_03220 [Jeotgalicoccus aerolatus]